MPSFYVPVVSVGMGVKVMGILADYDAFQLEHRVRGDYTNAGGIEVFAQSPTDGDPYWESWYDPETGEDDPRAWLEAAPIRDRNDALALAAWDALAVGDPFPLRPDSLTIIKKNRGSIRTSLGTVWTCEEVTGLSPARVRELRERVEVAI